MVNYELISVRMGVGGLWHNKTVKYEIRVATKILPELNNCEGVKLRQV